MATLKQQTTSVTWLNKSSAGEAGHIPKQFKTGQLVAEARKILSLSHGISEQENT